ncbi:hypothetical protein D6817_00035 [Candidatus Pacearchaeota archaeon]|nr:MAG: hypothetical protein D6817_00035 [Candidatus Pacearchaeota archaeon]
MTTDLALVLNLAISLATLLALLLLFQARHSSAVKRNFVKLAIIWFAQLVFLVALSGWTLFGVEFNSHSFLTIFSLVLVAQTLALAEILNSFRQDKTIRNLTWLYILALALSLLSLSNFPTYFIILSFLFTLLLASFIPLICTRAEGMFYTGLIYSLASLALIFLKLFSLLSPAYFTLFSNTLFLLFILFLVKELTYFKFQPKERFLGREQNYFLLFIRYFIFILVMTNFIFIATIALHELSHSLAAMFYGCESKAVIYSGEAYPYSEIICNDLNGKLVIALAGPLVPLLVGIALLFVGGRIVSSLGLLTIGFNLIASTRDFSEIGLDQSMALAAIATGAIVLLFAVIMLAKARIESGRENL